ncbi:hypothetical protein O5D80_002032 [Batrachochytrium dendrobatidis]|nr:hypothetical protein O5D80_002032 [Batrachochytrium dendrobatidis]
MVTEPSPCDKDAILQEIECEIIMGVGGLKRKAEKPHYKVTIIQVHIIVNLWANETEILICRVENI